MLQSSPQDRCQGILEQDLRNVRGKLVKLLIFAQSRQCSVVSKKEGYKNEKKKKKNLNSSWKSAWTFNSFLLTNEEGTAYSKGEIG